MVQWFFAKSYYPKVIYFTRLRFFGGVHKLPDRFALPLGRGRGMPRPYRAVYPLYRIAGMAATGGIYAAPTDYP